MSTTRLEILNRDPEMIHGEAHPASPCYFMIQYGHVQRWGYDKTTDVRKACHQAFGMAVPEMRAWNLGTRIGEARKLAKTFLPLPSRNET